jgi:hypothetical protein
VFVDLFNPGSADGNPADPGSGRPRMVTLAAHEYRWIRVLSADERYASGS